MNKTFATLATIAWASVALSSATPANASAYTMQSGNYAACSANYSAASFTACDSSYTTYIQTIKFIGTPCDSGDCSNEMDNVYTDQIYDTGRKTAYLSDFCHSLYVYGLGSCSC
jgi:hypothetical protein